MALVQALTDGGGSSPSGEESPRRRRNGTTAPREKPGGCGGTVVVFVPTGVDWCRPLDQPTETSAVGHPSRPDRLAHDHDHPAIQLSRLRARLTHASAVRR